MDVVDKPFGEISGLLGPRLDFPYAKNIQTVYLLAAKNGVQFRLKELEKIAKEELPLISGCIAEGEAIAAFDIPGEEPCVALRFLLPKKNEWCVLAFPRVRFEKGECVTRVALYCESQEWPSEESLRVVMDPLHFFLLSESEVPIRQAA